MTNWKDLSRLHVVKQSQKIIWRWWKADLLILNEKDILPESANEDLPFQNPFLKSLFQKEDLRQAFFKALREVYQQKDSKLTGFMKKWAGLNIFISPVQNHFHTAGFVVSPGFLIQKSEEENQQSLQTLSNLHIKLGEEGAPQMEEHIPWIPTRDKSHFMDLIEMTAKEIAEVQNEFVEQKQKRESLSNPQSLSYGSMVGKSPVMCRLYSLLDKIKHSHNIVLIQGENGTGKELIAKSIHLNSLRKGEAFLAQNCSALNDNLLESELFGHVKGAFTGAYKDKQGLFELADKGTFFLDEVGDTSPAMQVKLLRVIQEGTFFPVGGVNPKKVDVRIIAATNKNLKKMVEEGSFREDLYYRLNVINIQAPALRERTEDIALLAEFFINQFSPNLKVFTKKALEKLNQYHWPGNVRELQNEAERLAVFTGNDAYIKEEFLSEKIRKKQNDPHFISLLNAGRDGKTMKKAIAQLERQMISQSLKQEGWNKTRVAKKLGISRAALVSKVKDYKLERRTPVLRKKTGP